MYFTDSRRCQQMTECWFNRRNGNTGRSQPNTTRTDKDNFIRDCCNHQVQYWYCAFLTVVPSCLTSYTTTTTSTFCYTLSRSSPTRMCCCSLVFSLFCCVLVCTLWFLLCLEFLCLFVTPGVACTYFLTIFCPFYIESSK